MIKYDEALEIILKNARQTGIKEIDLESACSRILAEDIIADIDMPIFNKSRMDGYACRKEDLKNELEIIDTVYAGDISSSEITPLTCIKIMTGAVVPKGADCVIKVEETEKTSNNKIIFKGRKTDANISFKGEDFKKGDTILKKGVLLAPQHIAILATLGKIKPKVALCPKVSLIVTGDELTSAEQPLKEGHIRDSNTPQLKTQIKAMGADLISCMKISDTLEQTTNAIKKALYSSDLILLSGGVSMGDYDFVPKAITDLGGKILIEKVAVKPGKPSKFAVFDKVCCLGLPGNPVAAFVQFEILAKQFLYKMMGHDYKPMIANFILSEDFIRKDAKRQEWYPVQILDNKTIKLIIQKSSGDIASLAYADGLMIIEQDIFEIKKGAEVNVRLLRT